MKRAQSIETLLNRHVFITEGGMETTLVFREGIELPSFAAFTLLGSAAGLNALIRYYRGYLDLASRYDVGFIIDSVTWRANPDWGKKLGYSTSALGAANTQAIELIADMREQYARLVDPILLNGCVGPRGDGYAVDTKMSAPQAEDYHAFQVRQLARSGADLISGITINYVEEAIGIVRAAVAVDTPVVISFTTETDGRLPSGQGLGEAIEEVDAETGNAPAYFMINCAHSSHYAHTLDTDSGWTSRVRGLRSNASRMSHEELDNAEELDDGDPCEFGHDHASLHERFRQLRVFGGCCGTDLRHVESLCDRLLKRHEQAIA